MLKHLLAFIAVLSLASPVFAAGGGGHGESDLPPFPRPLEDYRHAEQERLAELITEGKIQPPEGTGSVFTT